MAGAVINSLRYEYSETGEIPYATDAVPVRNPCAGLTDAERAKAAAAQTHPD